MIQLDLGLLNVAARAVWFKAPVDKQRDTVLFINNVKICWTPEAVTAMHRHFDDEQFRRILRNAYSGIFDARSWAYWHCAQWMNPTPPLPFRRLPGVSASVRQVRH